MLQQIRNSASSWVIKTILIFVALSFVVWGVGGGDREQGGVVAVIDGTDIKYNEFKSEYNNIYQYFKKNNPVDINNEFWEKVIRQNAINNIVLHKIESEMADRMELVVSDKELADRIQRDPNFLDNGKFDRKTYLGILRANKLHPGEYEEDYRKNAQIKKMENIIASGVLLSEREVMDSYSFENEQIKARYLSIDNTYFEKKVDVDDERLKKFFESAKDQFKTREKLTTRLLVSRPSAFEGGIKIDEKRVADFYEENNRSFFIPRQVRARHILLRSSGGLNEEEDKQVLKRAEEVLDIVKRGGSFSEHAKKYSDDFSANEGGDLGFFSRGRMVKPFEDAAFSLKEGEISNIVKTQFGYHIIKVEKIEDEKVKPFEIVRVEIENKLKQEESKQKARAALENILKDGNLAEGGLKGFGAKTPELKIAEYILTKGDSFHRALSTEAFSLDVGEVSGIVEEDGIFYIVRPVSRQDSFIPEFSKIKGEVELAYRNLKGKEVIDSELTKLLDEIKNGKKLGNLALEKGFSERDSDYVKRGGFIAEVGMDSKAFIDKAFQTKNGEYSYCKGKTKSYILVIEDKKDIDKSRFAENKKEFMTKLLEKKRGKFLNQWRQGLLKSAEEEGRLKISEGFI